MKSPLSFTWKQLREGSMTPLLFTWINIRLYWLLLLSRVQGSSSPRPNVYITTSPTTSMNCYGQ